MPQLHYSTAGNGMPLVIMHGLFGSSKNWQSLSRQFAADRQAINIDLRNHGRSFHSDEMNYPAMAADVASLLNDLGLEAIQLMGHSMGGKVAMMLAASCPELVGRLIVADIAPVAYLHHYDDLIEPILALSLEHLESRDQADQLLRQNIPEDQLRAFLLQNLVRESGIWSWRVNWQAIQRGMEHLTGFDGLSDDWSIDIPTLFIRGANSDYIGAAEIDVIEQHFAAAEIATIDGAGHWLHAEKPETFANLVRDFLP